VIAEGVETEAQLLFLRRFGCDEMQGFYFAPSMTAEDCGRALTENWNLSDGRPAAAPLLEAVALGGESRAKTL